MAVPPFKRYKPSLTHTGSMLTSGLAAAMDLMSPSTPGPNAFAGDLCMEAHLQPHPWARLQAVLASSTVPPLMQLAAAHQLPRLFALWQSHGENLVATEMSLMSNASACPGGAHGHVATSVSPCDGSTMPAMTVTPAAQVVPAVESCMLPHHLPAVSDLLMPPVPVVALVAPITGSSVDSSVRSAAGLPPQVATVMSAQPCCLVPSLAASAPTPHQVTCTFAPTIPESWALPVQCCPPQTGNVVASVKPIPAGFALTATITTSSGTTAPPNNEASSMFVARLVKAPQQLPVHSAACHVTPELQESSGMLPARPPTCITFFTS